MTNSPTRITGDSLIDLILTSVPLKIQHRDACKPGIFNHHFIYVVLNFKRIPQKLTLKFINKYLFLLSFISLNLSITVKELMLMLCNQNPLLLHATSVTALMTQLIIPCGYGKLTQMYYEPLRKAKVISNSLPWMTSLRKELNKRFHLLKACNNSKGSNEVVDRAWIAWIA